MKFYFTDNDGFLISLGSTTDTNLDKHSREGLTITEGVVPDSVVRRPSSVIEVELSRVEEIKQKAHKKILTIAPEWKQRNLIATGLFLTEIIATGGALTSEQQTELDAIKVIWIQIAAIRQASSQAELDGILAKDFNP